MRARPMVQAVMILGSLFSGVGGAEEAANPKAFPHPYGSPAFVGLVVGSTRETRLATLEQFTAWMDADVLKAARHPVYAPEARGWPDTLAANRVALEGMTDPAERSRRELSLGAWLHGAIKKALPNYNLDRGFELANTARRKERQCLMQSLLITSLLQAMGVEAGLAMVNRNADGEFTNNAHVVALLKLSNGHDALVDGSYRTPLVAHRGLMVMRPQGSVRYVRPVYTRDYREIQSYVVLPALGTAPTETIRPMDIGFVQSQIDYYRGERTPGGVLAKETSQAGLERSVRYFQSSLEACPANPLPAYMLGVTYSKQGREDAALEQYREAHALYTRAGWVPDNVQQAVSRGRFQKASR